MKSLRLSTLHLLCSVLTNCIVTFGGLFRDFPVHKYCLMCKKKLINQKGKCFLSLMVVPQTRTIQFPQPVNTECSIFPLCSFPHSVKHDHVSFCLEVELLILQMSNFPETHGSFLGDKTLWKELVSSLCHFSATLYS